MRYIQLYEYLYSSIQTLIGDKKMKIIIFKVFMKKYILKNDTTNETELQRVYISPINPRDTKSYSDKRFVKLDDGRINGTHGCAFYVKNNKSYYFDSFGGQPDKFLKLLPKLKTYHKFEKQDRYSELCGSYCLYFFYLFEKMNFYDTIL